MCSSRKTWITEAYREFRKEVIESAAKWELFKPYKGFTKLYLKFMHRTRLSCKVLKTLRAYKREVPIIEVVETIIEPEPDNRIKVVNTMQKDQSPIYSLKFKCKFQIQD